MQYSKLEFDYKRNLNDVGLISGEFKLCYNIFKNLIGSYKGDRLYIDEISNSRMELRLTPIDQNTDLSLLNTINDKLNNYIINFGNNDYELIVNWVVDDNIVIIKLANKLPLKHEIKDELWISQIIALPIEGTVEIFEKEKNPERIWLQGPNLKIKNNQIAEDQVGYKTWTDLVSSNTVTAAQILGQTVSSSLGDSSILNNIDYSNYNNFIHFSSAEERLKNFQYKLQLIEMYDAQAAISYNPSTGSYNGVSQSIATYNTFVERKQAVINSFDGYEQYLYYASSSNIDEEHSSGYGTSYSTTWPKSGNILNQNLYSVTSSEATEWFTSQSLKAINYDLNNPHALLNTLPQHMLTVDYNTESSVSFNITKGKVEGYKQYAGANAEYLTFVYMIGHYFDLYWNYINGIKKIYKRSDNMIEGVAKDLLSDVLKSLGLDIDNSYAIADLWDYYNGTNSSGEYLQTGSIANPIYSISKKDYTSEINNRLLNNLSFLYKTKGSERSIRALLNCYGIPNTLLKIKEYGGPTGSPTEFYDYNYALDFKAGNNSYITSSYTTVPNSIELRFNPTSISSQTLMNTNGWELNIEPSASSELYGAVVFTDGDNFISSSYFKFIDEDNFWNILLSSGSRGITLSTKCAKHGKIFYESTVSSSLAELGIAWHDTSTNLFIGTNYTGSIQEFRMWSQELLLSDFDEHTRFKKSIYVSTGSAYNDLITRYTFNTNINHSGVYTRIKDSKPNIVELNDGLAVNFPDEINYTGYQQLQTAIMPSYVNSWTSNKVRLENITLNGTGLSYNHKCTTYQYDDAPLDSPKVGIFFSPTNIINEDIVATYGGITLDNYIGDPNDQYNSNYTDLTILNESYFQKYTTANSLNNYLRYIRIIDNVLFTTIKKFLPARSKKIVGVVIEPHILNRSKNQILKSAPLVDDLVYRTAINKNITSVDGLSFNYYTDINTNIIVNGNLNSWCAACSAITKYADNNGFFARSYDVITFHNNTRMYIGYQQDNTTTPYGKEAVEIFFNNPNKLVVIDEDGDGKLKIK